MPKLANIFLIIALSGVFSTVEAVETNRTDNASFDAVARVTEKATITRKMAPGRQGDATSAAKRETDDASISPKPAGELIASSYRAYPPSCLNDGFPEGLSGPLYQKSVTLAGDPISDPNYTEPVLITVWRVACSNKKSVALLAIDRLIDPNSTSHYPVVPGIRLQQGGINFDDPQNRDYVRIAVDPNTVFSAVYPDTPLINRFNTFVLENFTTNYIPLIDFNSGFIMRFDNFLNKAGVQRQFIINVPSYIPTQATYPEAFQPLLITGYMSSNWYDPAHSGEGIMTQVFEIAGDPKQRVFTFAWFTYDQLGLPFWLFGSGTIYTNGNGSRIVTIPTYYFDNGGFAGAFGNNAALHNWGSVTFSFPDCNHMDFHYNGSAAEFKGPVGNDNRHWSRLANINGLTCE